jgi:hypothetical protein
MAVFVAETCVEVIAVVVTLFFVSLVHCFRLFANPGRSLKAKKAAQLEEAISCTQKLSDASASNTSPELDTSTTASSQLDAFAACSLEQSLDDGDNDVESEAESLREWDQVVDAQMSQQMVVSLADEQVEIEEDDSTTSHHGEASSLERSTAYTAEGMSTNDDIPCDDGIASQEWEDVSCKLGRMFQGLAEDKYDTKRDQVADASRFTMRTHPEACDCTGWELLESYGTLDAPSGTWRSGRRPLRD